MKYYGIVVRVDRNNVRWREIGESDDPTYAYCCPMANFSVRPNKGDVIEFENDESSPVIGTIKSVKIFRGGDA